MGRERSNRKKMLSCFLLNCDHEREDCKCRMKGKRNEASLYVLTSLLHRDKHHGIKEKKQTSKQQQQQQQKNKPPSLPKLVTKMKTIFIFFSDLGIELGDSGVLFMTSKNVRWHQTEMQEKDKT